MVILMACAIERRPQWATSPSRRNNATRSRRTLPRRKARLRQSPSKTATAVPSSPWRRGSGNSPDGRCPKRGNPWRSLLPTKRRILLSDFTDAPKDERNGDAISAPVSWALNGAISRRRTKKKYFVLREVKRAPCFALMSGIFGRGRRGRCSKSPTTGLACVLLNHERSGPWQSS